MLPRLSLVVLWAIMFLCTISSVTASGKINYGSRVGMQVTVVSMLGLDTSNAVIRTQHTRQDAIEFCREYVGEVSEKCIEDELAVRLNDAVFANCLSGVFTNFWGDKLRYQGPNQRRSEFGPKYIIRNLQSGEVADGSSASNYSVNMEIFTALCPKKAPNDFDQ